MFIVGLGSKMIRASEIDGHKKMVREYWEKKINESELLREFAKKKRTGPTLKR